MHLALKMQEHVTGAPFLPLLLNEVLDVLSKAIRQEKEMRYTLQKGVQLALFLHSMSTYRENL